MNLFKRIREWWTSVRFGRESRKAWCRDLTGLVGSRTCFNCRHCSTGIGRSIRNCSMDGGPCLPDDEACEYFRKRF